MRKLAASLGTVKKLKLALLVCLNEKEYDDITIGELTRIAMINRTTFYLFYGSKDELLIDLCDAMVDKWFQPFFDVNMAKQTDREQELFHQLLMWLRQWRSALNRMLAVRTSAFDGFTLFTEIIEKRMASQQAFATEDEKKQNIYALFIKMYSVGLVSMLKWWLETDDSIDAEEFHAMIDRLRFKGYYSILSD